MPVGLEVVDEAADGDGEPAEHDDEQEGFPDDAVYDFLPGVGGDESVGFVVDGPSDYGHPEWGKYAGDMDCGGDVAVLGCGFGAVGLEWHRLVYWTGGGCGGLQKIG